MSDSTSIPIPPPPGKDPPPNEPFPTISTTSPSASSPHSPSLPFSSTLPNQQNTSPSSEHKSPKPPADLETASISSIPQATQAPARPAFSPFFTLVNDNTTKSTHHPSRIHYLFSDDDSSDLLTSACMRSLQPLSAASSPSGSKDLTQSASNSSSQQIRTSSTSSSSSATFKREADERRLKGKGVPKAEKREERIVIVDVNESGDGILRAHSLSEGWQVIGAELANAPTWDGADASEGAEEAEAGRGLMLKIEGLGIVDEPTDPAVGGLGIASEKRDGKDKESGVIGDEEMQVLLDGFDRKMGILRKIVGAGESWSSLDKRDEGRGKDEREA